MAAGPPGSVPASAPGLTRGVGSQLLHHCVCLRTIRCVFWVHGDVEDEPPAPHDGAKEIIRVINARDSGQVDVGGVGEIVLHIIGENLKAPLQGQVKAEGH
jgi:hypothetical protein